MAIAPVGAVAIPFQFAGREGDGEIGLYYYRARYYDPILGRFLQEDPLPLQRLSSSAGDLNSVQLSRPVQLRRSLVV